MKNDPRDIKRGAGNRVAEGAMLLQEGDSPADHSHVERTTPLKIKMKQTPEASELGIDAEREKRTTRLRRNKDVKPI